MHAYVPILHCKNQFLEKPVKISFEYQLEGFFSFDCPAIWSFVYRSRALLPSSTKIFFVWLSPKAFLKGLSFSKLSAYCLLAWINFLTVSPNIKLLEKLIAHQLFLLIQGFDGQRVGFFEKKTCNKNNCIEQVSNLHC